MTRPAHLHPSWLEPREECDDEDAYGFIARSIPDHIKRRAAAEWAAMDWKGDLPAGWINPYDERN